MRSSANLSLGQVVTIVLGQVVTTNNVRAARTDGPASELCADND